jgi:hypothetical protein
LEEGDNLFWVEFRVVEGLVLKSPLILIQIFIKFSQTKLELGEILLWVASLPIGIYILGEYLFTHKGENYLQKNL